MAGKKRGKLYTLTEVSKRTGISMPTLQRYKKSYQDRIPSEGTGRTQRYPTSAIAVFNQLKKENLKRRGRPPKNAAAKAAKPAPAAKAAPKKPARRIKPKAAPAKKAKRVARKAAPKKATSGLLTLTAIGKRTGISYPTLLRYVRSNLKRLAHEGAGRARRFHPEAVAVFEAIRDENAKRRGGARKAKAKKAAPVKRTRRVASAAPAKGDSGLAKRVAALEVAIGRLQKAIERPIQVTLKR